MLPKDYIRYRLCGAVGTDCSDASGSLLYNIRDNDWDQETIKALHLPAQILPCCHQSCEIAGEISTAAERETGLPQGVPVVYGGGDTPMQLVGNGVIHVSQLCTNIGTASQILCICAKPPAAIGKLNIFHHIAEDHWIAVGASLNGGNVLKWIRTLLMSMQSGYRDMDAMAEKSTAGANGLVMLPFLCGQRSPYMDEHAKGILFGMTLSHTAGDVVRSAMEGVIYSFRDCMSVFEETALPMTDEIIAAGGGARSRLWLQMQADILQKAVRVNDGHEEACTGAAIVAGVGCGVYASLREGCQVALRLSNIIYEPNRSNRAIYEDRFQTYRMLYQNNKELFVSKM